MGNCTGVLERARCDFILFPGQEKGKMKIKIIKAKKGLGFTELLRLTNLELELANLKLEGKDYNKILKEFRRLKREFEFYKKPGFYTKRKIEVANSVPKRVEDETICISFSKSGYEIRSGKNFIHTPLIKYGNLRYASIDLGYLFNGKMEEEVLDDLKGLNNGILYDSR